MAFVLINHSTVHILVIHSDSDIHQKGVAHLPSISRNTRNNKKVIHLKTNGLTFFIGKVPKWL